MCSLTQYLCTPGFGFWATSLLYSYSVVKLIQFQDFETIYVLMTLKFTFPIQIFSLNSRLIYPASLYGCKIDTSIHNKPKTEVLISPPKPAPPSVLTSQVMETQQLHPSTCSIRKT